MSQRALDELRRATGTVHVIFSLDESASKAAFDEIYARSTGISCWRFCSSDRQRWFVVAMGEQSHRDEIDDAVAVLKRLGATRAKEPQEGMIEALRERRWQTAIAEGLATGKNVDQRTHFGGGARLHRDGTMGPHKRPQG